MHLRGRWSCDTIHWSVPINIYEIKQKKHLILLPGLSMHLYLYISRLTLSFISVVGQGGKCHILNQLLELLIACHKVCLTVYLHKKTKKPNKNKTPPERQKITFLRKRKKKKRRRTRRRWLMNPCTSGLTSTITAALSPTNTPIRPSLALRPSSLFALLQPSFWACSCSHVSAWTIAKLH